VTLVEIMVALTIASGVFLALGMATIAGVKGTLLARQNQLAADMVNQAIERVRALDFADVANVSGDAGLAADPRISGGKFDPGTGTAEDLVLASVGTLNPHTYTETRNGTTFTISRYVTEPDGISTGTRRLTVVVTWPVGTEIKERSTSTFVTATRRGLPLPRFLLQFRSPSVQTPGAGTTVAYGLRLKNYGARDAWNIVGPTSGTWTYVVDTDKDGVLDASETTALTDTNADGTVDTGAIEVNGEVFILASTTAGTTVGSVTNVSWTFTSIAQPTAATASQSLSGSFTVSGAPSSTPTPTPTSTVDPQSPWPAPTPSCGTTCTLPQAWFHELPLGAHANTGANTAIFDTNATLQTAVYDYSVGKPGSAGRYVERGGTLATETNRDRVLDVRQQANAKINVKTGQAVAYLYVACLTGSGPVTLNVGIGDGTTSALSSYTQRGTGSATLNECDGTFKPLVVGVPLATAFSVNKNRYLVVRVTVPSTATTDVRIGYDWAGAASSVVIPQ
jgi:hypothetical protein